MKQTTDENYNKFYSQYEITKIKKLYEINNEMVHNFYYLVYVRIYNEQRTKYKRVKFILFFDAFDIQEYFEKDFFNNDDIKQIKYDYAFAVVDTYIKKDFFNNCTDFINYANETIKNYNK